MGAFSEVGSGSGSGVLFKRSNSIFPRGWDPDPDRVFFDGKFGSIFFARGLTPDPFFARGLNPDPTQLNPDPQP